MATLMSPSRSSISCPSLSFCLVALSLYLYRSLSLHDIHIPLECKIPFLPRWMLWKWYALIVLMLSLHTNLNVSLNNHPSHMNSLTIFEIWVYHGDRDRKCARWAERERGRRMESNKNAFSDNARLQTMDSNSMCIGNA